MKRELEKYGLQLPSFSKIGGILAKELSVDEAAGRWGGGASVAVHGASMIGRFLPEIQAWREKRLFLGSGSFFGDGSEGSLEESRGWASSA